MAQTYFAIDLGERLIKIADFNKNKELFESSGLTLFETEKLLYSTDTEKIFEEQGRKISEVLGKLNITKKNVNVVIPDSLSYNQIIEMPQLNEKELLSAIKYQADQFIPMAIEDVSLDVEILHEYETQKRILTLISAAPKKIIERVQKVIEYAGLIPSAIETEVSATGRFLSEIYKISPEGQGTLFVNLGISATSLYFYKESLGLITQIHNFSIGYQLFLKEIQINLKTDEKKSIELLQAFGQSQNQDELQPVLTVIIKNFIIELQRFINQLTGKHEQSVKTIVLCNEAVHFKALQPLIEHYFKIPTQIFDPTPLVKSDQAITRLKNDLGFFVSCIGGNLR